MGRAGGSSLAAGSVASSTVGGGTVKVGRVTVGGWVATDGLAGVVPSAGAQAASKMVTKIRVNKERIFIIFL
jgi:hypothetical protein